MKLHIPWGGNGRFECGNSEKRKFLLNRKITCWGGGGGVSWNLLKYCLSFGGGLEGFYKEKGDNRKKRFYSEMWENAVMLFGEGL